VTRGVTGQADDLRVTRRCAFAVSRGNSMGACPLNRSVITTALTRRNATRKSWKVLHGFLVPGIVRADADRLIGVVFLEPPD
jgi:hypothetical protein